MAASPRAVTAAFEQVLPLEDRPVGVHPAGGLALLSAGPTFVGYAEAGKRLVADAMLGAAFPGDVWVTVTRGPTAATLCRHISSP